MSYKYLIATISLLFILSWSPAQIESADDYEEYYQPKKQAGFVFSMAETGSGFGGFIGWPFIKYYHMGFTLDIFFIRDSREFTYEYLGYYYRVNKENNVYIFDLLFTIKRRFFAQAFEDNFRPFLTAAAGAIYGMNFPEFDTTLEGIPTKDQFRWTYGGFFGFGTDISTSNRFYLSIRAQYRIMPFSNKLGERSNHSMFELRFEIGRRF